MRKALGVVAWVVVLAFACAKCGAVEEALGPIPSVPFRNTEPFDGGVR
jgi:hypothetical protein